MNDLLALNSFRPATLPVTMQQITTPLQCSGGHSLAYDWEGTPLPLKADILASHSDPRFRRYLSDCIREGFRIGFDYSQKCHAITRNVASSISQPTVVQEYLASVCHWTGPPFLPDFLPAKCSSESSQRNLRESGG